jgi:hypothetical protein
MSDINPEDCKKQWDILRQVLFDENPSLGAEFSRLNELPPDRRQATLTNLLAEGEDEDNPPVASSTRQTKSLKDQSKAWKLGYK